MSDENVSWFRYVRHAIGESIKSERGADSENISSGQRRFHYSSKADARDRLGSKHPTVKPVDLMRWLCRLVPPPGGTILDPFAGTGTTGEAALLENFSAILIEREAEYRADIARRMAHVFTGAASRKVAIAKAKGAEKAENLPLFGGVEDRDKPGHDGVVLGDASEEG